MEEYIVVKKKFLEDAIKEYSSTKVDVKKPHVYAIAQGMLGVCQVLLEKGKPLQPIIEDAFNAGFDLADDCWSPSTSSPPSKEEYIENLKIN